MFLLNFAILLQFFRVYFNLRDLSLSKFSRVYAYLGAYAYCFRELFQGLCLIGGLRLLGRRVLHCGCLKTSTLGAMHNLLLRTFDNEKQTGIMHEKD